MSGAEQAIDRAAGDARPRRASARFTARDVGSLLVVLLGLGVAGSALLLNPVTGALIWHEHVVDKRDVLVRYFWTAGLLGAAIVALGVQLGRRVDGRADGPALLAGVLCLLVVVDRLLLVQFGLPLWIHDPVLHYRHRPNAVRTLARAGRPKDLVRINAWGHHDTDFPRAKPAGELRGLMIGDSVTMGDQVVYAETFSAQLEERLRARAAGDVHTSFEMINAGVHGYTSLQEVAVLRESMAFDPDFVVVGFCLNDLTDPSVLARGFEGRADDYHHVAASASPLQGWWLNETGLGRLVQELRGRGRTRSGEQRLELEAVQRVARAAPGDPAWRASWGAVEGDIAEMAAIARAAGRPMLLVVFPFTFQLLEPGARSPQAILAARAEALGIDFLDLTDAFASRIYADRALLDLLRGRGLSNERIERIFEPELRRYFLDGDHLTGAGHAVVAEALERWLEARKILRTAAEGSGLPEASPIQARRPVAQAHEEAHEERGNRS